MEPETESAIADATSPSEHPEAESRAAKARKTRLDTSTSAQRRAVARKAANTRWSTSKTSARNGAFPRARSKRASGATTIVFGKALAAAENRLAAAIQERAYHTNMTAMLDAEIPSLVQTISALQSTQNPQSFSQTPAPAIPAAARLASTVRLPAAAAQGAAVSADLSDAGDEDQFLKESDVAGGSWH